MNWTFKADEIPFTVIVFEGREKVSQTDISLINTRSWHKYIQLLHNEYVKD